MRRERSAGVESPQPAGEARREHRPPAEHGRATIKLPRDQHEGRRTWRKALLSLDTLDAAADRGRDVLAKTPDKIAELEGAGRGRAPTYKALVLTGLRRGELASLTVGRLELDPSVGGVAYATLPAADDKSGKGADIPLRSDLVDDISQWLAERLDTLRTEARAVGAPIPAKLAPDTPLFDVPTGLIRVLDRDLMVAGIPKRDDWGRTIDVHAMRHTFGTHLSKGGVAPRTAQAVMRHGLLDLTMNTYTDPRLLDVAGALDVLPSLPLDAGDHTVRQRATGTDAGALAPVLAPNPDKGGHI